MSVSATSSELSLVTGATGLLGSHLAEQLCRRGVTVRALVRPTSDIRFLQSLGVECVVGDLTSPESCRQAIQGVDRVYHAAAKVGDWGDWVQFERDCLVATRVLARAACEAGVHRFVQFSSTSAYGHPREGGPPIEETHPLGEHLWPVWDYYTRSKVECEKILWGLVPEGLRLTIIRPSWLYGERDRTTTERIVRRVRTGIVSLMGSGTNPLSAIYAGCVAEAAILAANTPAAEKQAYNVTDQGPINQREFFNLWARAAGAPPVKRQLSYPFAFNAALGFEAWARLWRSPTAPLITRYSVWLMGRNLAYSSAKIRKELGWSPSCTYQEGIERTVRWFDAARQAPHAR